MLYKTFSSLSLLILAACGSPATTERVERYENGVVSRIAQQVDGKYEGLMTDYYPDGKLMAERQFKNGLQSGQTRIYYPSGKLKEVQYYHDGLQTMGDTLWYESGQIQFVVTFKENKKNGYLRKWDTVGSLIYESKFEMDTLVEVKGRRLHQDTVLDNSPSNRFIKPSKQF